MAPAPTNCHKEFVMSQKDNSQNELEELKAKLAEAEQALQAERERAAAAEQTAQEALAAQPAAAKPKSFKPKNVKVISATEYSYLLEDNATRITPNAPVGATRAPGNLLDCLMEKGFVVEYEV